MDSRYISNGKLRGCEDRLDVYLHKKKKKREREREVVDDAKVFDL